MSVRFRDVWISSFRNDKESGRAIGGGGCNFSFLDAKKLTSFEKYFTPYKVRAHGVLLYIPQRYRMKKSEKSF